MQPGDLAEGLRTPRDFDFGGQWNFITELPQDWENRLLKGTNTHVHTRTQEKGAVSPQETEPDLCVCVSRSLWQRLVLTVSCSGVRTLNTVVCAKVILKEVAITFITPTIFWPQAKQQGKNTALLINRKLD